MLSVSGYLPAPAPLMASVVAHLGTEDMLTAAAYLASLKP